MKGHGSKLGRKKASVAFKLMADPTTPASVRAHLALSLLDHANDSLEIEDLALRIDRLEAAQENRK